MVPIVPGLFGTLGVEELSADVAADGVVIVESDTTGVLAAAVPPLTSQGFGGEGIMYNKINKSEKEREREREKKVSKGIKNIQKRENNQLENKL
jgi:hypothetical protein